MRAHLDVPCCLQMSMSCHDSKISVRLKSHYYFALRLFTVSFQVYKWSSDGAITYKGPWIWNQSVQRPLLAAGSLIARSSSVVRTVTLLDSLLTQRQRTVIKLKDQSSSVSPAASTLPSIDLLSPLWPPFGSRVVHFILRSVWLW